MKKAFTMVGITALCIVGAYLLLTWGSNGNPRFMHHRYNSVITRPLAHVGFADAQFKMGLFYYYGSGFEANKKELENAVYWWEKASAKGHKDATAELANARSLLDAINTANDTDGYAYWQAQEYYRQANAHLSENDDAGALEYTMKALATLERLKMQSDSLYIFCLNLIPQIEEIAKANPTH